MKRSRCVICNFNLKNIYVLNNVPVKLACTTHPVYNKDSLSFAQCEECFTIQLDKLIPLDILYSESHNYTSIGRVWEEYFSLFYKKTNPIVNGKNVLEIGCPSGKIALHVTNYNKWYIVEPNKNPTIMFNDKITFIERFFDNDFVLDEEIHVIIHSHVFEHIYNFNDFLKKCNDILQPSGEMFFGIPNMEHFTTTDICPFLGIFFEHTCFLNKDNVHMLLHNNNFEVIECIDYVNHSTLYHCRKKSIVNIIITHAITNYYDSFFNSIYIYNTFIERCNNIIRHTIKKVYIFDASYNTQLLLSLGLDVKHISGLLDNCVEKQNKHFYGYNIIIYNPLIIKESDCIIIIKNGYYTTEIIKQLYEYNLNTEVIF